MRDMIDQRQQHGEYHHLVQELQAYFRLTKEQLDPLLQEASTISRAQTNFRSAHRAPVHLCCSVHRLFSGDTSRSLKHSEISN